MCFTMESIMYKAILCLLFFVLSVEFVSADDSCYQAGFVATSVVLSIIITLLIVGAIYYWRKRRPRTEHLILETDPEKGKAAYAFDNPVFKDSSLLAKSHDGTTAKNKPGQATKQNWNHWSGISALTLKKDKKKSVDDSSLGEPEVKTVALKSHDFAGLGFNICGNMKDGIHIKDILNKGPASESGKLNPGDRIMSVTIDFEHIVQEDALNILSFASPYEIKLEVKSSKISFGSSSRSDHPRHPIYRSTSSMHLLEVSGMGKKGLQENSSGSHNSTSHKSLSNTTTLERKVSELPGPNHIRVNEQLKNQLEQRITSAETEIRLRAEPMRAEVETQKSENKHQKFGIKVFPTDLQRSPKTAETSQNDNNINIEKHVHTGVDEVDGKSINIQTQEEIIQSGNQFNRNDSVYGSGLKRDENGIPQEIPSHMLNAAVAARRNRKSQEEIFSEEDGKILRKKGKAPPPPTDEKTRESLDSSNVKELGLEITNPVESLVSQIQIEGSLPQKDSKILNSNKLKNTSSDSEEESDNQSSVNTIELNSCDITIHQGGNEEKQGRRTASTGDLTKIKKTRKSSTGTLERAQSLDITDSGIPNLTQNKKGGKAEDIFDMNSNEDFFVSTILNKEPRLSLILDGLNTFQRNRLKKSTEWGNLEDVILKNRDEVNSSLVSNENNSFDNSNCSVESAEMNAVVNKINEIKNESNEIDNIEESKIEYTNPSHNFESNEIHKSKNQLWPTETSIDILPDNPIIMRTKCLNMPTPIPQFKQKMSVQNEIWPRELTIADNNEGQNTEEVRTSSISIVSPTRVENSHELNKYSINFDSEMSEPITKIKQISLDEIENKENSPRNATENLDVQKVHTNLNKIDPINSITVDNMILSERIPANKDTEKNILDNGVNTIEISTINVNSHTKLLPVAPSRISVSNTTKTHKRQQIPDEQNEIPFPPETKEADLEKEMFAEYNNEVPKKTITKSNLELVSSTISKSFEALPHAKENNFLLLERNSETGELCSSLYNTDESKTLNDDKPSYANDTESFIYNEKYLDRPDQPFISPGDTNISDDIKVSRHSFGSLERPKSDDAKSIDSIKYSSNVSNVTVNNIQTKNNSPSLHSLELSVNDSAEDAVTSIMNESELYTTAMNHSLKIERDTSKISLNTPDLIKNVSIAEAINTLNGDMGTGARFGERDDENLAITISSTNLSEIIDDAQPKSIIENVPGKHSSLTYITEIQVTPTSTKTNVSEIEILPPESIPNTQKYTKNFDNYTIEQLSDEKAQSQFDNRSNPEKELHKIREIAEEQLKKLPEMRFSTSSYENSSKNVEKKQSQVELLKSNFEKSPPKSFKSDISRSRIPISTTMKTPPTSPEREKVMTTDNEKELFESMSYIAHSTPMAKSQKTTNDKNITVTSIRTNSRIPSGLPIVSGIRPPVPPKRTDHDNDSISSTNSSISSFKQWVFNPYNSETNFSPQSNNSK